MLTVYVVCDGSGLFRCRQSGSKIDRGLLKNTFPFSVNFKPFESCDSGSDMHVKIYTFLIQGKSFII